MDVTLAQAIGVLEAAGDLRWRRPLTDVERMFGDVERVSADFDDAELLVIDEARPVVKRIQAQLIAEVAPLLAARDLPGIARLRPSFTPELAAVLKKAAQAAREAGTAQVLDNAEAQTGKRLARKRRKPATRKQPEHVPTWVDWRSEAVAEQLAAQQAAVIGGLASRKAITDDLRLTLEDIESLWAAGEKALVGTATSLGRESYGLGRLVGLDEIAADIDYCVYTAILDENTCGVCADMDGTELGADGIDAAPNDECEGGERCRCFVIAVLKDGS